MSFNIKNYKNNLLFLPLGGTNEIGMNLNLYHFKGKWIMIDCGSGFADENVPGTNILVANINFIKKYYKDLLGLIITHAHEDHLGGVQYLWDNLKCPIYTTPFTNNFLKTKIKNNIKIKINVVQPDSEIKLGPFKLNMITLTHSAPEMQSIMIQTDIGNVFHTGDWKLDHNPVIGNISNLKLLKSYAAKGVLALVCDSTNVFNKEMSGSEGTLQKSLNKIISKCNAMVLVTTFSSNIARISSLIEIAKNTKRKIVLIGKSLHNILEVAQNSGFLKESIDVIIDENEMTKFERKEILIIATGCQGEPLAATTKIAYNKHHIKLAANDTVIFSSKIIPGNEKKIFKLFNLLIKSGIEVITERDHFVHVSGHPSIEELTIMYDLIKPEICIPVHGEPIHIHEQAKLAHRHGIKNTIKVENGSLVLIDKYNSHIITNVESGYLGIDGNTLLPIESSIFKERKTMNNSGVIVISLLINKLGILKIRPILSAPGILDKTQDIELINFIKNSIENQFQKSKTIKNKDNSSETIEKNVKAIVRKILKDEKSKKPLIIINIETVIE